MTDQLITITFNEGLWGLGKTYDINQSDDFHLDSSTARSLGEARYFRPWTILELVSSALFKRNPVKQNVIHDRTPLSYRLLLEHGFLDLTKNSLGLPITNEHEALERFRCLEEGWLVYLESIMVDLKCKVKFVVYQPSNLDQYIGNIAAQILHHPEFRKDKMLCESLTFLTEDELKIKLYALNQAMIDEVLKWKVPNASVSIQYSVVN